MKALFTCIGGITCIGGTNHGHKTPYKGHEIQMPEKRKYEDRFVRDLGGGAI